jgi:DnaK suppressor protein
LDQATLERLRSRLDDERGVVVTQLVDMGMDPSTGAPNGDQFEHGFADSGQATAEKARVLSMVEGLIETLHEIDAAIDRISKGTYGRCESCGAEIPAERLDARPVARLCVACKQRAG